MHIKDVSTPVVVLRAVRQGGLAITRSLGRLGVPVYNVDFERTPAFSSRYSRDGFLCRGLQGVPAKESVSCLLDIARRIGRRALLIPTTDDVAILVAEHAEELKEWFIFPDQRAELVRSLCSKKEMFFLAKKHGVATAETAFPQCKGDVLRYLQTARFPIMLKGIYGERLKERAGKHMFIVQDEQELLQKYESLEDPSQPNVMLQEFIPGGDDSIWMFNGYFNASSECLVGFTGKKIRQCPVYTGPTCLGVCLRNDHVDQTTRTFMRAIGYKGVLDIGYRFDARDGHYKVLDVNPRIGATFRLFLDHRGLDVARALYLDMTGQPIEITEAREGRKWIVEDCDLVSCFRYYRDGKLGFREWLRSFRGIEEAAFWAVDDLSPMFHMYRADFREFLSRLVRRARRLSERALARSLEQPHYSARDEQG